MNRIVFLLEERSMQVLLDGLLPRLFPDLPMRSISRRCKTSAGKPGFGIQMR